MVLASTTTALGFCHKVSFSLRNSLPEGAKRVHFELIGESHILLVEKAEIHSLATWVPRGELTR